MPQISAPPPPVTAPRASPTALAWRLVEDGPCRGATNMARDHALALCLGPGEGVVRLYGWSTPTVSFGKNEPATRLGARTHGAQPDYVRRPTGGRAVYHDDELTYSVVAPLDAFGGLREAYLGINETLAHALRSLGASVDVSDASEALAPDAGPCFQAPARGEIVARGRKVVGSAQARLEGVLLQHGSILLGGGQGPLGGNGTDVTLLELLGAVDRAEVTRAVGTAVRAGFGGEWELGMYDDRELEAAQRLETDRYGQDTWTWRR